MTGKDLILLSPGKLPDGAFVVHGSALLQAHVAGSARSLSTYHPSSRTGSVGSGELPAVMVLVSYELLHASIVVLFFIVYQGLLGCTESDVGVAGL